MEPESREYACGNDEASLSDLFAVIRKRRLVVLFCILIVLGAAAVYAYRSPNVYRISNLIVIDQTTGLETQDIFIFLGDQDLLSRMKYKSDLDGSVLDKIIDVKAVPFKKNGVRNENAVQVDVLTVDEKAGVSFIEYLPRYIQTRPFIARKLEDSKRRIRKNISDLQLFKDDPIKALHISGSPVIIGPEIFSIYDKYNQYREMLEQLERLQIVRLAGDTYVPVEPYGPKKALIIAVGLFAGLLFGICCAFVLERISGSSPKE